MKTNKYLEDSDSVSESDDEIDIHDIVQNGTIETLEWALVKDCFRLLHIKDEVDVTYLRA